MESNAILNKRGKLNIDLLARMAISLKEEVTKDQEEQKELYNNSGTLKYKVNDDGKTEIIINKATTKDLSLKDININRYKQSLSSISKYNIDRVTNANILLSVFPDLELCSDILVSSILSPNLLSKVAINQSINSDIVPTSIKTKIMSFVSKEINTHYELESRTFEMLETSLVKTGAYCEVIINDNSLNKYIDGMLDVDNITNESLISSMVSKNELYQESSSIDDYVTITKNTDILKLTSSMFTTEALKKEKKEEKNSSIRDFFRKVSSGSNVSSRAIVESSPGGNEHRPLTLRVPMESVIPICMSHEPDNHLGYFLMLDSNGTPIKNTYEFEDDVQAEDNTFIHNKDSYEDKLKESLKKKKNNNPNKMNIPNLDSNSLSQEIVENVVRSFVDSEGISGFINDETLNSLYRVMFFRTNEALKTNIVYVPKENMFYMAFKYASNGTGIGLLDGMHDLANDRLAITTSKLHAQIKNNIPDEVYDIQLDNDEQDPKAVMAEAIGYIMESKTSTIPKKTTGILDKDSLSDWAMRLGTTINVKHDKLPNITINKDIKYANYQEPVNDLEDKYKGEMYMKFSLTPEMVLKGYEGELATTIRSRDALFTKRIIRRQQQVEVCLTDYVKKIIKNDGKIYKGINNIIEDSFASINKSFSKTHKEYLNDNNIKRGDIVSFLMLEVIENYKQELIRPEDEVYETTVDNFKDYKDLIEDYLDNTISEETLPDKFLEIFDGNIDKLRTFITNKMLNVWMVERKFHPELTSLFSHQEDGSPSTALFNEYNEYSKSIVDSFGAFKKSSLNKDTYYKELQREEDIGIEEKIPKDNKDVKGEEEVPLEEQKLPEQTAQNYTGKSIVGIRADEFTEECFKPVETKESFKLNTVHIDVSPSDLYQMSLEMSVGSTRGLLGIMRNGMKPNNYHSRIIGNLLYGDATNEQMFELKKLMIELKSKDVTQYNDFLKNVIKQNYANLLSIKVFNDMERNKPVIGINKTIRSIINNTIYEETANKTSSINSLYITSSQFLDITNKLKGLVKYLMDGNEISSKDYVELDSSNINYLAIEDPNNVYFIGEKYIDIENTVDYKSIYYNIDVNKTIELNNAILKDNNNIINKYLSNYIKDIESSIYVVFKGDSFATNLLDVTSMNFLPKVKDMIVNPFHAQRMRLMNINYKIELENEFEKTKVLSEEYINDYNYSLQGVIEINNPDIKVSSFEDVIRFNNISYNLNLGLLVYYAIDKEKEHDVAYAETLMGELKTLFHTKEMKDYIKQTYFNYNNKADFKLNGEKIDIVWGNINSIVENIITIDRIKDEEYIKNSPLTNYIYAKSSHIATKLVLSKRDTVVRVLKDVGHIEDKNGKVYKESYFYRNGILNETLIDSLDLPLTRYGLSKVAIQEELKKPSVELYREDIEEGDSVDTFIKTIDKSKYSSDGLRNYVSRL